MDYPVGGVTRLTLDSKSSFEVKSLVEVLCQGLRKFGGELRLACPVEELPC